MGLCEDILSKMPPQYDVEAVQAAYPTTYEESMNTVLTQECIRYNTLLGVMDRSLRESVKALKGLVVMSPELEGVAFAMYDNQVRGGVRGTVDGLKVHWVEGSVGEMVGVIKGLVVMSPELRGVTSSQRWSDTATAVGA